MRAHSEAAHFPFVLIADTVTQEWIDRLTEGAIDDLILRSAEPAYWQFGLDLVLRNRSPGSRIGMLSAKPPSATRNSIVSPASTIAKPLLAMLFRETDRVQRMNSAMSLVLFDIDDFGHWNSRLGVDACDELALPGGNPHQPTAAQLRSARSPWHGRIPHRAARLRTANAMVLTERLRIEVFASPFHVAGESIRLSACFGIAVSHGRSPVVVLREAEKALGWAKAAGPETIQCFGSPPIPLHRR